MEKAELRAENDAKFFLKKIERADLIVLARKGWISRLAQARAKNKEKINKDHRPGESYLSKEDFHCKNLVGLNKFFHLNNFIFYSKRI